MNILSNKIFILSLLLLALGIFSLMIEHTFYQFVDQNGILHESMFLPLGTISIAIGVLLLLSLMQKYNVRLES